MIYTKKFDFGSKSLKIEALKELSPKIEQDIKFLLDSLFSELNHNVRNSSAEKFNSSQLNIPVFLHREFIDFLEYNADFYLYFQGDFDPFGLDNFNSELRSFYIKDQSLESIVKLANLTLDSSFLRSTYIIELLKKFLAEKNIKDFKISTADIILAAGDKSWESRFKESEFFKSKTFDLKNSLALLIKDFSNLENSSTFATKEKGLKIKELILLGENVGLLKLLERKIKNTNSKVEITQLAKRHKFDVAFIDEKGKVELFKGLQN